MKLVTVNYKHKGVKLEISGYLVLQDKHRITICSVLRINENREANVAGNHRVIGMSKISKITDVKANKVIYPKKPTKKSICESRTGKIYYSEAEDLVKRYMPMRGTRAGKTTLHNKFKDELMNMTSSGMVKEYKISDLQEKFDLSDMLKAVLEPTEKTKDEPNNLGIDELEKQSLIQLCYTNITNCVHRENVKLCTNYVSAVGWIIFANTSIVVLATTLTHGKPKDDSELNHIIIPLDQLKGITLLSNGENPFYREIMRNWKPFKLVKVAENAKECDYII